MASANRTLFIQTPTRLPFDSAATAAIRYLLSVFNSMIFYYFFFRFRFPSIIPFPY